MEVGLNTHPKLDGIGYRLRMKTKWHVNTSLIARYNNAGPRYTSYPTAVDFVPEFTTTDFSRALKSCKDPELSIYVHVPFCESPCFYCGCNKVITRDHSKAKSYLHALCREIKSYANMLLPKRRVNQIHFGGGTPTFINDQQLQEILNKLTENFEMNTSDAREYSIEIDPRTVSVDRLDELARMGFNRISLGVQDLDPAVQRAVNREQSAEQTFALITRANELGMSGVSVDLIYGLPLQNLASFKRTIDAVITAKPDRLSLYSYAHLPSRFKAQRQIKAEELPGPEIKLALLANAIEQLTSAGYEYIGMDHFALKADSMVAAQAAGKLQRNFQGYSTHAGLNLIGLGVSAISRIGDVYAQNAKVISIYEHMIERFGMAIERGIKVTEDDRLRREVIETILCSGALIYSKIEVHWKIKFAKYFERELKQLMPLEADGLLIQTGEGFILTPMGRLLMRNVAMCFDVRLAGHQAQATPRFSKIV